MSCSDDYVLLLDFLLLFAILVQNKGDLNYSDDYVLLLRFCIIVCILQCSVYVTF